MEFDELKRRLCAVTDSYRAPSAWYVVLPYPLVGALFVLPSTVLRDTFLGAVLPVVALFAVYAFFFARWRRTTRAWTRRWTGYSRNLTCARGGRSWPSGGSTSALAWGGTTAK